MLITIVTLHIVQTHDITDNVRNKLLNCFNTTANNILKAVIGFPSLAMYVWLYKYVRQIRSSIVKKTFQVIKVSFFWGEPERASYT